VLTEGLGRVGTRRRVDGVGGERRRMALRTGTSHGGASLGVWILQVDARRSCETSGGGSEGPEMPRRHAISVRSSLTVAALR